MHWSMNLFQNPLPSLGKLAFGTIFLLRRFVYWIWILIFTLMFHQWQHGDGGRREGERDFCLKFETTFFTIHHLICLYPRSEFWAAADVDWIEICYRSRVMRELWSRITCRRFLISASISCAWPHLLQFLYKSTFRWLGNIASDSETKIGFSSCCNHNSKHLGQSGIPWLLQPDRLSDYQDIYDWKSKFYISFS